MATPGKYSSSPQGGITKAYEDRAARIADSLNPFGKEANKNGTVPFYQTGARALIKVGGKPLGVCQTIRWTISYNATPINTVDTVHPWDIDIGQVSISATLDNIMDPTKGPEADGLFHTMASAIHQPYVEIQVLDAIGSSVFFARGMFVSVSSNIPRGGLATYSASFIGVAYQHNVNQAFEPYGLANKINDLVNGVTNLASDLTGGIL